MIKELIMTASLLISIDQAKIDSALDAAADKYGLDRLMVHAVAVTESGKDPYKTRFEKEFFLNRINPLKREDLAGWKPKPNSSDPSLDTEKAGRSTSWGTLQTMGDRLRLLGFDCPLFAVLWFFPEVAIDYGCKYLKQCLDACDGDWRRALLRYNGGGNKSYPDIVFQYRRILGGGGGGETKS